MKNKTSWILAAVLVIGLAPNSWAKPERMEIEKADKHAKKLAARSVLKGVDVAAIEDPEARKAIIGILNYLTLSTKK